jgi:hypothetical protein
MTAALILGAISTKGRPPLRHYASGVVLRRRHHHPHGTRCVELRDAEPQAEPMCPPSIPDWAPRTAVDPALDGSRS